MSSDATEAKSAGVHAGPAQALGGGPGAHTPQCLLYAIL